MSSTLTSVQILPVRWILGRQRFIGAVILLDGGCIYMFPISVAQVKTHRSQADVFIFLDTEWISWHDVQAAVPDDLGRWYKVFAGQTVFAFVVIMADALTFTAATPETMGAKEINEALRVHAIAFVCIAMHIRALGEALK